MDRLNKLIERLESDVVDIDETDCEYQVAEQDGSITIDFYFNTIVIPPKPVKPTPPKDLD